MSDIPSLSQIILEMFLPMELIENILSRLPVKTLKRFRAVEKSWCRLIDSEKFAKTHLQLSLASKSNRNLISGSGGFWWMSVDSLEEMHPIKPGFEEDCKDFNEISNSCNGLVVVRRDPKPLILFNPFTREHKVLPLCPQYYSPSESSLYFETTYGFGYDSKNDDYKVVTGSSVQGSLRIISEEWIYSLRADCWRRRTKGTYCSRGNWPAHVNGVLHTLFQSESEGFEIMGFSVETEEDYEVPKPEGIDIWDLVSVSVDVLDGDLALICVYPTFWFVIWVMKEYGVKESWAQLTSFGVQEEDYFQMLAYLDGPDKILVNNNDHDLILFGVRKPSAELIKIPFLFDPRLCLETLVSPHGWAMKNCSADKLKKERRNKVVKKRKKRDEFLPSGFKLAL